MAAPAFSVSTVSAHSDSSSKGNLAALAVLTSLFFMWGFLTCLNDIIIPHFKAAFDLTYAKAMLVQFAFFTAFFAKFLTTLLTKLFSLLKSQVVFQF